MANGIQKDLGKVTAYSYAKAAGYTGTEEQFQAIFNEFTENAPGLIDRMDTAVERAEAAVTNIDATIQDAVDDAVDEATASAVATANQAVSDAQAAQTAAEGAVTQANNAVTQANEAVTAAQAAQSAAEDAAESFALDRTLTDSGAAAPADLVGDLKESLNIQHVTDENFVDDTNLLNEITWSESGYMRATNGALVTSQYTTGYIASDFVPVVPGFKYRAVNGATDGGGFTLYTLLFSDAKNDGTNINLEWVSAGDYKEFTVPEGKTFVSFNCVYNGQNKLNALYRRTQYEDEKSIKIPRLVVDSGEFAGKTICNFGDSIFGLARPPVDISTYIANLTGATVYNCAFGGCQMGKYEPSTSGYAAFAMYKLADAISSGNWAEQENAIAGGELPTYFAETVQLLKSINWNNVDIITISYGTNDFENGLTPTATEGASNAMYGVSDALQYSINKILSAYPAIRIFVCLPCYRVWVNGNAFDYDSNMATHTSWVSGKTYTFKDFVNAEKEVAIANQIPYIDNYNIGVNQYNWSFYLPTSDGTHYNSNGRMLIAQKMVHELF